MDSNDVPINQIEKDEILHLVESESLSEPEPLSIEIPQIAISYRAEYSIFPVEFCGVLLEEFTFEHWKDLIKSQISNVIALEAPISRDQLCRRVLSMWGISRIGSRIDEHFNQIFDRMNLKFTGVGKGRYFWKNDQDPKDYMNYRIYMTNAADICPEEVSVAVREVLEAQISLSREDLIRETARLFGFARLGNIVESSMQQGIDKAIQRGFAKLENDRIILC